MTVIVPEQTHTELAGLYRRGLYLQAYRMAEEIAPLKEWTGADRVMAARLAAHMGAPRLSLWHRLKSWREAPDHPEVKYY